MTTNLARLPVAPPSSKIPEGDVSANRLASILVSAVIEHEIDEDGDIYATDGLEFPVWISVDADRKFLSFTTYYSPAEDRTWAADDMLSAVNDLNETYTYVQFHWRNAKNRVAGNYFMTFDGGLDPRQFIKLLRHFSGAFCSALQEISAAANASQYS